MVCRGYRDLIVFQAAYELALTIHQVTKSFPVEEKYDEVGKTLAGMINKADKFCF
jgi:hypothetical protein